MQSQNGRYGNRRALDDSCLLLKVNTFNGAQTNNPYLSLQRQVPGFPHGWLNLFGSLEIPTKIEWNKCDRVHKESSARKVTHPSTILTLPRQFNP